MIKTIASFLSAFIILMLGSINTVIGQTQMMQSDNQNLTSKQEKIVLISALTAKGDMPALEKALSEGLDAGLSVNEIKEVLVQLYAYCGFPRSLMGINNLMAVLKIRAEKGIHDNIGAIASPITSQQSKYERGKAILEVLIGGPDTGKTSGFGQFSPEIDDFLKEHLFADIFERDVLNYIDRELATISALIALGGVEPMMQSHMNMGMNVGLTESQIKQTISLFERSVSQQDATIATKVLAEVIKSRR